VRQLGGAGRAVADRHTSEGFAGTEHAVAQYHQLDADAGQRQGAGRGGGGVGRAVQVEDDRLVPCRVGRRLLRRCSLPLQLLTATRHLHPHERICNQT